MYINRPIDEYLTDLAAKKPAPGGGSASALTGATGASLISMVANFTIGKERYKEFEEEAKEILRQSEEIRSKFMRLVDEDVEAYTKLSAVFKTKKGTNIDDVLKEATSVPMEIARLSLDGAKLCGQFADKCNRNLISDIGVAIEMLEASYNGAKFNVDINLNSMKDEKFIVDVRKVVELQDEEMGTVKSAVLEKVQAIMRG